MSQSATVSITPNGEKVSVEVAHKEPKTAEGFVEAGMVSSKEDVASLASQQWRIKAQRAARDEMEKAWENGVTDEDTLQDIAQDAFDTYVYGGRRSSGSVLRAVEEVADPENPTDQELSVLERIDENDNNVRVIWAGISR